MKAQEIRAMTDEEIHTALENARLEMFNLRIQHVTGRLPDTSRIRTVRQEIARLLTVRRERQLWVEFEAGVEE